MLRLKSKNGSNVFNIKGDKRTAEEIRSRLTQTALAASVDLPQAEDKNVRGVSPQPAAHCILGHHNMKSLRRLDKEGMIAGLKIDWTLEEKNVSPA